MRIRIHLSNQLVIDTGSHEERPMWLALFEGNPSDNGVITLLKGGRRLLVRRQQVAYIEIDIIDTLV
jgi:hypothetical protein